jgi:hypothetical protein
VQRTTCIFPLAGIGKKSYACLIMTLRQLSVLLAAAAVIGVAHSLRVHWIENQDAATACEAAGGFVCGLRYVLLGTFNLGIFGWTSIAAGVFAVLRPTIWSAGTALMPAAAGLVLYNTDQAVVGALLGIIALARSGRMSAAQAG